MKPPSPEHVADIRDALSGFLQGLRRLEPHLGAPPSQDSIADKEQKAFAKPYLLVDAYGMAGMLVESSADHIDAFVKTITEPMTPIAACSCVRALLEPCAMAAWLSAPTIGALERAKRVFAIRHEAIEEHGKFANAIDPAKTASKIVRERVNAIEREAIQLGIKPVRDRQGNRVGIGCPKPGATTLIADMLGEAAPFRLLSAVVHGQPWALRQMSFERVEADQTAATFGDVQVRAFKKAVSPKVVAFLGVCALRSFSRPVTCMLQYSGHDSGPFDRLLATTFDFLQVPEAQRHSSTPK
jgi:hypothetical protein